MNGAPLGLDTVLCWCYNMLCHGKLNIFKAKPIIYPLNCYSFAGKELNHFQVPSGEPTQTRLFLLAVITIKSWRDHFPNISHISHHFHCLVLNAFQELS